MNRLDHKNEDFALQIEVIAEASSSQRDRAEFIGDPFDYAEKRGVKLDKEFAKIIRDKLILVKRYAAVLGCDNPHLAKTLSS